MSENLPTELVKLQEQVAEIFWLVKKHAQQARGENGKPDRPAVGTLDETERAVHARLMAVGRQLLGNYFQELERGDLGYRIEVGGREYVRRHRRRAAAILTVFGTVTYEQSIYYRGDGDSWRPLAGLADLPERKVSYFAQQLMARLGIEETYGSSQEFYRDFFGHSLSPRTIEEVIAETAANAPVYEAEKPAVAGDREGKIGVVSFDAKGIPVVPHERTTGKTREALVGCVYTSSPEVREVEALATALTRPPEEKAALAVARENRPEKPPIVYHGSVDRPKEEVFKEVQAEANRRFVLGAVTAVVCVMDGAPGLWRLAKKYFPEAVGILDLMHVLTYLWEAARALEGKEKEARRLVHDYLVQILAGRVGRVIVGLRIRLTKNRIQGERRRVVEKAISYFDNHRDYMRYDQYLAAGYPIASGVIESACGHLVKQRMSKAGARWSLKGAEAVLKLRCVQANGHWREFHEIRQRHERDRLYSEILRPAA